MATKPRELAKVRKTINWVAQRERDALVDSAPNSSSGLGKSFWVQSRLSYKLNRFNLSQLHHQGEYYMSSLFSPHPHPYPNIPSIPLSVGKYQSLSYYKLKCDNSSQQVPLRVSKLSSLEEKRIASNQAGQNAKLAVEMTEQIGMTRCSHLFHLFLPKKWSSILLCKLLHIKASRWKHPHLHKHQTWNHD